MRTLEWYIRKAEEIIAKTYLPVEVSIVVEDRLVVIRYDENGKKKEISVLKK